MLQMRRWGNIPQRKLVFRSLPSLHPAFGPKRLDFHLEESLEVLLGALRLIPLQFIPADLQFDHCAKKVPGGEKTSVKQKTEENKATLSHQLPVHSRKMTP